ncbi:MAG: ATP-binding cassette domain-containing protein [Hymenobacter sp.]
MPSPLLTVSNLTIDFTSHRGDVRAVNDVSFELHRGETLAIVGESGSGKSVTSLALAGADPNAARPRQRAGQAVFQSEELGEADLLKLSEEQLQRVRGNDIGMIFQEPMTSLNPVHHLRRQVVEALRLHTRLSEQEAEAAHHRAVHQAQLPRAGADLRKLPARNIWRPEAARDDCHGDGLHARPCSSPTSPPRPST